MGNIGQLLAKTTRPEHPLVCFSRSYPHKTPPIAESISDLIKKSEIIFISTPSKTTLKLIEEIAPIAKGKIIINTSVGFTNQTLKKRIRHARVIQLIPSMAAEDGAPAYFGYVSSKNEKRLLEKIFKNKIRIARFDDDDLAEATALISCLPAFIYAMIAKIIKNRRYNQTKKNHILTTITTTATSKVVREKASGAFILRVRSKGGATEAGINQMSKTGADNVLSNALDASAKNIKKRIKKYAGKIK